LLVLLVAPTCYDWFFAEPELPLHVETIQIVVVAEIKPATDDYRMGPTRAAAFDLDLAAQLQALGRAVSQAGSAAVELYRKVL